MGRTIVLVSCVASKTATANRAGQLYTSPWFRKASSYARQIGDQWYILSAKHGLVDPESVIEPYDETLNTMRAAERRAWARRVLQELQEVLHPGDQVVFLAGQRYRENLVAPIKDMGCSVEITMEALGIGEQTRCLNQRGSN